MSSIATPLRMAAAVAFLAVILAPTATACSLLYMPYDQATWETDLHYVDGGSVRRVQGGLDTAIEEGYFMTYATKGNLLLVGGQDGLGAGCEGEGWLRLLKDGQQVWQKPGIGRVWPHADGPLVVYENAIWRLQGEELVRLDALPPGEVFVSGWTADAKPVYRGTDGIVVGARVIKRADVSSFEPTVAHNDAATGLAFHADGKAMLYEVTDGAARYRTWTTSQDMVDIIWANGWYVLSGGRAFHIGDKVTDLGLAAVALGTHGDQALVFTQDGYTVFEGTRPVEAAKRLENVWVPTSAQTTRREVAASEWQPADMEPRPTPPPGSDTTTRKQAPAPEWAILLASLAFGGLAARRRKE